MIGIIGGGISGLALSHALERAGLEHILLEASSRVGGVIRSRPMVGTVVDYGPQRTRVSPGIQELVDFAGLSDEVITVPTDLPLYVYRGSRLWSVPFSVPDLIRSDVLSRAAKFRILLEPLTRAARPDDTVGGLLTRKFGQEAYNTILGPLFGGLYGSDPGEMYVRHALTSLLDARSTRKSLLTPFLKGAFSRRKVPSAISFQDGMEALPRKLGERLAHRIRLDRPVSALEQTGVGWRLKTPQGDVVVDQVVITCEAAATAQLLGPHSRGAAERLERLVYNDLVVVHLKGERKLHGLGYQVSYGEALRTRGVTWNASALERPGLYTAFLGGARDPEAPSLEDGYLGELACREFREATGVGASVVEVSRTRIPSWDRSWAALDGLVVPPRIHLLTNFVSRVGIPGRVAAARALATELTTHA